MKVMRKEKVVVSWSGGKDSCLALYEILHSQDYEAVALLTTVTRDYDRISMHGVRRELLEQQAEALGLPLHQVAISKGADNQEYEAQMKAALTTFRQQGIASVGFGDLFLQDIKEYRERLLAPLNMRCVFPVWQQNTAEFIRRFIDLGFKAVVTCVNPAALDGAFAGQLIDRDFLARLPATVDPCGENGEFHTFVFDGPIFQEAVMFRLGETVFRDGFAFCDLLPEDLSTGERK
ncbi:MAG: diphthine--ammonia ligase [Acidobacteria bacterium]|nr:diphthine--ammonia ligase [Acidobacteriota bacterium]